MILLKKNQKLREGLSLEGFFEKDSDELTVDETATLLGVARSTVLKYTSKKQLLPHTRGKFGKILFKKEAVLDFKRLKKQSAPKRVHLSHLSQKYSPEELEVIQKWRVQPQDTSSVDVEIGLLTQRILRIEEELKFLQGDQIDFGLMRIQLLKALGERRKKLNFLQSTDVHRYARALERIELMN